MDKYSYIANATGSYIEELYADYQKDSNSVDESWQVFFQGFEFQESRYAEGDKAPLAKSAGGSDKEVNDKVVNAFKNSLFQKCFTNKWSWKTENNPYSIQRLSLPNTQNKYLINAHLSGFYYFIKHIF